MSDPKPNLEYASGDTRLDQSKPRPFRLDLNPGRNLNSCLGLLIAGAVAIALLYAVVWFTGL
jgi:hypothetical protein